MAKKKISELAMKVAQQAKKKPMSARQIKERRDQMLADKKKSAKGIARAGDTAIAPQRVAEVRKGASGVVEASKRGKVNKKDLPMLKQQELDFKELTKTAQRAERNKVRNGKPSKFSDYLKVVERQEVVKKSYGGGMTKKKTVKRNMGSTIAKNKKPKGVGCAMRGYGGAMKKS